MIRIKLYGIDGREKAAYELNEDEHLVIQPKPLFTLERIVVNPPEQIEFHPLVIDTQTGEVMDAKFIPVKGTTPEP